MRKLEKFLLHDYSFIILLGLAAAAVVGGTSMYLQHGTGVINEIFVAQMLDKGVATGDYSEAASFAAGFLIARVLEGPLVGILDIGGSLMTGIGVGIPALALSLGAGYLVDNFVVALLFGFAVGSAIGAAVIAIRKLSPTTSFAGATSIMMGAGNKTGEVLGPLVLLSATAYSIPAGVGGILGSLLFYRYKKPIVGGAILGAMLVGGILMLFGVGLPVSG